LSWARYAMSAVSQAYQQTQSVIQHAKSLFAEDPLPPTGAVNGAAALANAHEIATGAVSKTTDLSGAGVTGYRDFATAAAPPLSAAATNDAHLGALLEQAAEISRTGRAQVEALEQQVLAAGPRVAAATNAAAQRAVITELNSYVQSVSQVVDTAKQAASSVSSQIRTLQYPSATPAGDDYDLDTQYVRPASFTSQTPPPEGTIEVVTATVGAVTAVTGLTLGAHSKMYGCGSKGRHCED
jgi:hypothetical protein